MDDINKEEDNKLKPFNEIYGEYARCRDNKEDCDDKILMSEVSDTYQETRVEELPFLRKIEYFENITKPKHYVLNPNYFIVEKEETTNEHQDQALTDVSNNYTTMLLTVLATTSIYYFFFKLSK